MRPFSLPLPRCPAAASIAFRTGGTGGGARLRRGGLRGNRRRRRAPATAAAEPVQGQAQDAVCLSADAADVEPPARSSPRGRRGRRDQRDRERALRRCSGSSDSGRRHFEDCRGVQRDYESQHQRDAAQAAGSQMADPSNVIACEEARAGLGTRTGRRAPPLRYRFPPGPDKRPHEARHPEGWFARRPAGVVSRDLSLAHHAAAIAGRLQTRARRLDVSSRRSSTSCTRR